VIQDGQPPGVYKLTPSRHDIKPTLGGKTVSLKLTTYPLVPSYALTVEKIQGATLDGIVLGTLHHSSRKSFPSALLYVALSRVRRLQGLFLTEPLTFEDIRAPSNEIKAEIARLEGIPSYLE
jgi:ATP-dependent DNA helicase PIF1